MNRWVSFKPISYVGMVLALVSIILNVMRVEFMYAGYVKGLLLVIGMALIFKGRSEHGSMEK